MKTLQIILVGASFFLAASFSVNAQTNKTKSASTKQRTETKQKIKLLDEIPTTKKSVVVNTFPANTTDRGGKNRASEYFSMEKTIIAWSIAGEIPSNFPKHQVGQNKEQYVEIMKSWGRNNLNLIKPKHHSQIVETSKNN